MVITDTDSAGINAVQFSVYVQSHDGLLNGNALLSAVQVDFCTHQPHTLPVPLSISVRRVVVSNHTIC